jgi:lysophospholipase L1-like esterase
LYKDTLSQKPYVTDGGYAKDVDSAFLSNSNHFAIWGRAAAVSKGLIQGVLQQHNADLMLLMLGFNDMGWFYSDADGTIDSIGTLVSNARAANPNIKVAIANVPQRSYIGGREDLIENTNIYNNLLPIAIAKWSTDKSPIKLVDIANSYDCQPGGCPAGKQI